MSLFTLPRLTLRSAPAFRTLSTSAVRASGSEPTAQHPLKSDIDHLENPSHSEEAIHAEKHAQDPLPDHKKASSGSSSSTTGTVEDLKQKASEVIDQVKDAAGLKVSARSASATARFTVANDAES